MGRNIFRSKLWSSVRIIVSTNLHLDIQDDQRAQTPDLKSNKQTQLHEIINAN